MSNNLNLENSVDSPWWKVKTRFFMEIQPTTTWNQYRKNPKALYRQLAMWVNRAEDYERELRESPENLGEDQIEELVTNFLYPMDEIPMKARLEPSKVRELAAWLENPPERKTETMS